MGHIPNTGGKAGAYLKAHSPPPAEKPAFDYSSLGTNVNEDPNNQDMRNDTTIAAHRTAARTGTTYDMADVITHGHSTKLPGLYLPKEHPAMQIIGLNEQALPGDVLGVSPRHPPVATPVYERMAHIVRERSLDFINLMDDFLKRPQLSKMPTRNRCAFRVHAFACVPSRARLRVRAFACVPSHAVTRVSRRMRHAARGVSC